MGLDPELSSTSCVINRHDHAAGSESPLVLVNVLHANLAMVTTLVTMQGDGNLSDIEFGIGHRSDPHFAERKQRGLFHVWVFSNQTGAARSCKTDPPQ